jgi:tyrosyl-tRNA synthetase
MYGKTLSVPDAALAQWYDLLLGSRPPADVNPRDAKHALAHALVERFHGRAAADEAAAGFERLFVSRELPEEIEDAQVQEGNGLVHLPELIADLILDLPAGELDGRVLQVGKRRFRRLRVA